MRTLALSTVDNLWPLEEPGFEPDDIDGDTPLELDDEYWEALIPDDDYEPHPDPGDFWTDEPEEVGSSLREFVAHEC
jgi:hypothetical protein